MKKSILRFVTVSAFLTLLGLNVLAEDWRGITPIHSTRADVQKLFGKPLRSFDDVDHYEFADTEVRIHYVPEPCGGISDFGDYNVAKDTVLEIDIEPTKELPLKKFLKTLNITNMDKLETTGEMCTDIVHYLDKARGISFAVSKKTINSYTLGAKAADSYLLCREDEPNETL